MNPRIIGTLIYKDFSLFFRNRFFALMTPVGLIAYLIIYFVMPSSVNESLKIGLYTPVTLQDFEQIQQQGLEIQRVDSEQALKNAVVDGQYVAGIALPAGLTGAFASARKPRITVYFAADTPKETREAVTLMVKELSYVEMGRPLAIEVSEKTLGPDMIGIQIPPRDRLRPLFAVFLIIVETLGLATLISEEIDRRTIHALLITPVTIRDLFAAKGTLGVSLAFGQAALFMAIVGGVGRQPLIIIVTLLLGAMLATAVGFLIASVAKDIMSVMAWGVIAFIALIIPSMSIMFPGVITGWVKIIPSYYLVDVIHRAANFGSGWGDVWRSMLILLGFDLVIGWAGVMALGRKLR